MRHNLFQCPALARVNLAGATNMTNRQN